MSINNSEKQTKEEYRSNAKRTMTDHIAWDLIC